MARTTRSVIGTVRTRGCLGFGSIVANAWLRIPHSRTLVNNGSREREADRPCLTAASRRPGPSTTITMLLHREAHLVGPRTIRLLFTGGAGRGGSTTSDYEAPLSSRASISIAASTSSEASCVSWSAYASCPLTRSFEASANSRAARFRKLWVSAADTAEHPFRKLNVSSTRSRAVGSGGRALPHLLGESGAAFGRPFSRVSSSLGSND